MRSIILSFFAAITFATAAAAMPEIGETAPDFSATDSSGKEVSLSKLKGKNIVLEWHNPACPFIKKFYNNGDMQKLQAELKEKGAVWISINSGASGKQGHINPKETNGYLAEQKSMTDHYINDEKGEIGRLYAAKTTPHMFVINKEGEIAYMGAIDDKPSASSSDIAGAHNYVREAVTALIDGKAIANPSVQSYGCSIKYAG